MKRSTLLATLLVSIALLASTLAGATATAAPAIPDSRTSATTPALADHAYSKTTNFVIRSAHRGKCHANWMVHPVRVKWHHRGSKHGRDKARSSLHIRRCPKRLIFNRHGGRYDIYGSHQSCGRFQPGRYMSEVRITWSARESANGPVVHRSTLHLPCDKDTKKHKEKPIHWVFYAPDPCFDLVCPAIAFIQVKFTIVVPHWKDMVKRRGPFLVD